jgi:hypothetical protein
VQEVCFFNPIDRKNKNDHEQSAESLEGASCFNHPTKPAKTLCSDCGKLICQLCSTDLNNQTLCIDCLAHGRKENKNPSLETYRVRYDKITFTLAMYPVLLFPFLWFVTVITFPVGVFLLIKHWKKGTNSLIHSGRARLYWSIPFLLIQLIAPIAIIIFITKAITSWL